MVAAVLLMRLSALYRLFVSLRLRHLAGAGGLAKQGV